MERRQMLVNAPGSENDSSDYRHCSGNAERCNRFAKDRMPMSTAGNGKILRRVTARDVPSLWMPV
jgi:hypothetical protein